MTERLIERLRKIEALARSGEAGEQENAQRMLEALCEKYGITLEQIIEPKKKWCDFSVKDSIDEMLLTQVIVYVCQTREIKNARRGRTKRTYELTPAQAIDVADCYSHYRKAWRKQLNDLMIAFIHSNRIFGPPSDRDTEETPEEIERAKRIMSLMDGMRREQWTGRKRLAQ